MHLSELLPVLTIAVGPVILISGVGLLLLSMTNRLGRTIDRAHVLLKERSDKEDERRQVHDAQLAILWQRARLLRTAIILAAVSALLAAILIIVLFVSVLLQLEIAMVVIVLFASCLISLIAALVFFIRDINMSLRALTMELQGPLALDD